MRPQKFFSEIKTKFGDKGFLSGLKWLFVGDPVSDGQLHEKKEKTKEKVKDKDKK